MREDFYNAGDSRIEVEIEVECGSLPQNAGGLATMVFNGKIP
jgi:hypothetical protein